MTHSHLPRLFTYLGLRGSRKNSIAVFPSLVSVSPRRQRPDIWWIFGGYLVDIWSSLRQRHRYTTRNKGDFHCSLLIPASRGGCCRMGQSSSFVRGYAGADENADGKSKEGIDKGLQGLDTDEGSVEKNDSGKVSNGTGGTIGNEAEKKATADVLAKVVEAETILEAVVSPEVSMTNELDKKNEENLVSESKEASKPVETIDVKKKVVMIEEPVKSNTALNLALDELGEPPERPLPGDCCGQGCEVCVWDSYNDELREYLTRKKSLLKKSKYVVD